MAARNQGEIVATPEVPETSGKAPTIQQAFDVWKTGVGTRGEKLPTLNAIEEASHAVRRFRELHGNLPISEVTPAKARAFRDAVAKIPPRLPLPFQRLPLDKLLQSRALPAGRPAAATINKKLTLMAAILNKAAIHFGLKGGAVSWHNPFEGLKIAESRGAKNRRSTFSPDDLRAIVQQPFVIRRRQREWRGQGSCCPLAGTSCPVHRCPSARVGPAQDQ